MSYTGSRRIASLFLLLFFSLYGQACAATHGDLAVFAAKGYFRDYVPSEATLAQCVAFLNGKGICFSLLDILSTDKAVNKEDLARVAGQSVLLFSGEAEVVSGGIKKPLEAETWVDYCLLNDIDFVSVWDGFVQITADGSMPEVKRFFGR